MISARRRFFPVALTLALASTLVAAPIGIAYAEPGGTPRNEADRERARELMREGNELYGEGKLSDAFAKYLEAWRTAQTFDIACNLGGTASELSLNRDAAEYLDYCLRHYAASSRPEAVAAEKRARAAFEVVRGKVAAVTVHVTPAGSEVFVDGAKVGSAPLDAPVYLEAGPHRIEARHPGLETARVEIDAKRGETSKTTLELRAASASDSGAAAPPPADTLSPPDHGTRKNYVPPIIAASIGGAAIASGIVFVALRAHRQSVAEERRERLPGTNPCSAGTPNTAACADIAELSDEAAMFGTISLVSFGAAVGAGVATYILWPKAKRESGVRSARPTVAASHDGFFASVRAVF